MLWDLLRRPSVREADRGAIRRALRSPWGRPVDTEPFAPWARALLDATPVVPLIAGETLLASVTEDTRRVSLWRFAPAPGGPADAALAPDVQTLFAHARDMALTRLPALDGVRRLPPLSDWRARLLWKQGDGHDTVLRGASFGLALALGAASAFLDLPLRSDACFLAALGTDEGLAPVDGLREKVGLVASAALGLRTVHVHPDNLAEARAAAAEVGRPITVEPILSLGAAVELAFPNLFEDLEARWEDPTVARQVADQLFDITVFGSNRLLSWRGLGNAAQSLADRLRDEDTDRAARAALAARIAFRHAGDGSLIEWPKDEVLARLPRPLRLCLLAHAVQSAGDATTGHEEVYLEAGAAHVAPDPLDCHAEDLRLLGAMGRTSAAIRRHDQALVHLRRALEGWEALRLPQDSSYALCEYLRILGIRRDRERLDEALERWGRPFESHVASEEVSRGFVRLAAARALVQTRQPARAVDMLNGSDVRWPLAPIHLRAGRHRWFARAWRLLDRDTEAQEHDRALEQDFAQEANAFLNRFDRVLAGVSREPLDDVRDALRRVERCRREADRLLRLVQNRDEHVGVLVEEYRY